MGRFLLTALFIQCGYAWINVFKSTYSIASRQKQFKRTKLSLFQDFRNDDDMFRLSQSDLARIESLKARHLQIPILITKICILPGQTMHIASGDPKFQKLIDYVEQNQQEIGMIGVHPQTQKPLNFGVTSKICKDGVNKNNMIGLSISIEGNKMFQIEDEPFMDSSGSFYMANIEITDGREELMTAEQKRETEQLFKKIPSLVTKLKTLVFKKGMQKELGEVIKSIGPMPSCVKKRALWVGTLVNPSSDLKLCLEIRPAMLACRNNYERMQLAVLSIQHSIEILSQTKT